MLKSLRMRLRALVMRSTMESELDDELRFHLEQETSRNIALGMAPDDAARRARVALGGVDNTRESYLDGSGARGWDDFSSDLRYAARSLWRDRALSFAGVLTLALGIGATTAVFSAVNAVILRPLPFADPDALVHLWEKNPDRNWHKAQVAPANFLDWRERVSAFSAIAAYTDWYTTHPMTGRGEPRVVTAGNVTGNFFDVLGVRPAAGRFFGNGDDWEGGQRAVVISHGLWQSAFGSDAAVIGSFIDLGGRQKWQIIGVAPQGFRLPGAETDMWKPMLWNPANREAVFFRRAHSLRAIGRLKPSATPAVAAAQLESVMRQLETDYPATNTNMGAGVTPLHEWIVGDTRRPLLIFFAAAGVLLLIASANVGNLMLVHALRRSRDVVLRVALGASRVRVARQAVTESVLLALAGGVGGFFVGWIGARALLAIMPAGMLPASELPLDYRVLAFAVLLALASGIVFGVAPALAATRRSPAEALNAGGRSLASGGLGRWGRFLVSAEVALAVILLVGAGLLLRSYDRINSVKPGFEPAGVWTARVMAPPSRYDSLSHVRNFFDALLERVKAVPGVEYAGYVRSLPVTANSWSSDFAVEGRGSGEVGSEVVHREVHGDYFRALRVPLLRGRLLGAEDGPTSPPTVLINEELARRFFRNEDPVGKRITFDRVPDSTSTWRTIVGVVGSEHQASLVTPPRPEFFAPAYQEGMRSLVLVVRTAGNADPVALTTPMRQALRQLDSLQAFAEVRTMTDVHAQSSARERFMSVLVLSFAVAGAILALIGLFGVLAQLVQSRTRELGIRMALGAQRSDVRLLVVGHGFRLVAFGVVGGLLLSLLATRVLGAMLYGISPTDAVTYASTTLVVVAAGLAAAWIPARRASGTHPAVTLRAD